MEKDLRIPTCIGVVMDGNRRWAVEQKLDPIKGHKEGFKKFKEVIEWANHIGVQHLIFYAFSTENWNRGEHEVSELLKLFVVAAKEKDSLKKNNIKMNIIGDRTKFSKELQGLIHVLEEETKNNTAGTVTVALSYGGRAEILQATNRAIREGKEITEEEFGNLMWTKGIPDPDLIIRTGEAMRLSNFLPWQSVYSELYFSGTLWPDFEREEFEYILNEFMERKRRYGK